MIKISLTLMLSIFSIYAHSANFCTNFESTNFSTIQTFSITSSALTASFAGGTSFTIGNGALYHSGTKSWMIDPAGTTSRGTSSGVGTITLPTDTRQIDFYIRTSNANSTAQVQIIDTSDAVIEDITSTIISDSWLHIETQVTEGSPAIHSVLVNAFGSNMLAIDDLSFSTTDTNEGDDQGNDENTDSDTSSSSSSGFGSIFYGLFFIMALSFLRKNSRYKK
ncbi:MAG: hypothetical protein JKY50_06340 [Oleispira sp.]|nr:hypothetical protein [Oleispira sp.]